MLIDKDLISGLLIIFVSIIGFRSLERMLLLTPFHDITVSEGLGPDFFPYILLMLLAIAGVYLIIKSIISIFVIKRIEGSEIPIINLKKINLPYEAIFFVFIIIIYIKVFKTLGFLLTSFLFLCLYVIRFYSLYSKNDIKPTNIQSQRSSSLKIYMKIITINIVITFIVYTMFDLVAKVPLPKGIIERIIFGG